MRLALLDDISTLTTLLTDLREEPGNGSKHEATFEPMTEGYQHVVAT